MAACERIGAGGDVKTVFLIVLRFAGGVLAARLPDLPAGQIGVPAFTGGEMIVRTIDVKAAARAAAAFTLGKETIGRLDVKAMCFRNAFLTGIINTDAIGFGRSHKRTGDVEPMPACLENVQIGELMSGIRPLVEIVFAGDVVVDATHIGPLVAAAINDQVGNGRFVHTPIAWFNHPTRHRTIIRRPGTDGLENGGPPFAGQRCAAG